MKTSNIILLSLVGSITVVIITIALQLRFTGTKKSDRIDVISSEIKLAPFKYLVVHTSSNFSIEASEEVGMVIRNGAGNPTPGVEYRQDGDTLFINRMQPNEGQRSFSFAVKTPVSNLVGIFAEDASFSLMDFDSESLVVDLRKSRMNMQSAKAVNAGNLTLRATEDSHVYTSNVRFDTVEFYLDDAEARLSDRINQLRGSIKNGASVFAPQAFDIQLKRDSTSRFQ